MAFFVGLLELLKALPAIVKLITELSGWMKTTFGDDPAKFILDSAEVFERARNAKTPQEKQAAAGDIARLVRRL
jgi:hypothetical protein